MINDITEQVLRGEGIDPQYVDMVNAWLALPVEQKTEKRVFIIAKNRLMFMVIDREFLVGTVQQYIALNDGPADMTMLPAYLGLREIHLYTQQPSLYEPDGWRLSRVIMTKETGFSTSFPVSVETNAVLSENELWDFLVLMREQGQTEVLRMLGEGTACIHVYRDGLERGFIVTNVEGPLGLLAMVGEGIPAFDALIRAFDYIAGQRGFGTVAGTYGNPLLGVAAEIGYVPTLTTVILTDHLTEKE
ncbi:hypothetical protein WELLINGTON_135 [Erwinia phage Wellington]|uniref:Uncharacterized protein n=2 Tax=Wellingtonvirus wellington TaxID=2734153 RepID=A0A1B2IDX7_9CAUD|nr:hypothetical protein BIZ80_gp165 [Erwinia phage vB_EamM_Kwan]YP_009806619.1 hypothetical protein HOT70_gp166 [Erwinia phage Wellington]ANZ49486.1 hypothetical protein KWAN_134 [Erwinia phage vB_EamM_Kwan]AXF51265.1 hypothetical protein WELLINGTON_135 [Erwinia phage Wellington]